MTRVLSQWRQVTIAATLVVLFASGAIRPVYPQSRAQVVYVSALGGLQEDFENFIGPVLEKTTGMRLQFVPRGVSTEVLALIRAQRTNPQIDVAFLDEGPGYEGVTLGLFQPLDPAIVTNLKHMYPIAVLPGNPAVLTRASALGLIYHTGIFRQNRWPAPTRWADLFRPEFKKKIILAHSSTTFGPITLIQMAKMNGGDMRNIDPGFQKMKELAPSVLTYERTFQRYGELFQAGEAAIGVWSNIGSTILKTLGVPVDFVLPADGAYALLGMAAAVKGAPNPKGAQLLINLLLSAEVQRYLAETRNYGPLNRNTKLPPEIAEQVVHGADAIGKLQRVDWIYLNTVRAQWTERMAKEVETIR